MFIIVNHHMTLWTVTLIKMKNYSEEYLHKTLQEAITQYVTSLFLNYYLCQQFYGKQPC